MKTYLLRNYTEMYVTKTAENTRRDRQTIAVEHFTSPLAVLNRTQVQRKDTIRIISSLTCLNLRSYSFAPQIYLFPKSLQIR